MRVMKAWNHNGYPRRRMCRRQRGHRLLLRLMRLLLLLLHSYILLLLPLGLQRSLLLIKLLLTLRDPLLLG